MFSLLPLRMIGKGRVCIAAQRKRLWGRIRESLAREDSVLRRGLFGSTWNVRDWQRPQSVNHTARATVRRARCPDFFRARRCQQFSEVAHCLDLPSMQREGPPFGPASGTSLRRQVPTSTASGQDSPRGRWSGCRKAGRSASTYQATTGMVAAVDDFDAPWTRTPACLGLNPVGGSIPDDAPRSRMSELPGKGRRLAVGMQHWPAIP